MKARVHRSTGSWYKVITDDGRMLNCRIKGKLRIKGYKHTNPVTVGDVVDIEKEAGSEDGIIKRVYDRENAILRKATRLSKQTQIIAANMDQAMIILTLVHPKTLIAFVDRFLATTEAYNVPAVLVFNKADLYDEALKEQMASYISIYQSAGYHCLMTSAKERFGLDALKTQLQKKVTLLAGNSGVGKSSLINAVEPGLDLKVSALSEAHRLGRHTTTYSEMHPLQNGGAVIDTPGLKSFGLYNFEREEIYHFFPELFKTAKHCRFRNCVHINEPGCAVIDAVEKGSIAAFRYRNYLSIYYGEDIESENK